MTEDQVRNYIRRTKSGTTFGVQHALMRSTHTPRYWRVRARARAREEAFSRRHTGTQAQGDRMRCPTRELTATTVDQT